MNRLTSWIVAGMLLGVVAGAALHHTLALETIAAVVPWFRLLTDIFLRLIKMIVAPLVFSTIVAGIVNMGDSKALGRIGLRALLWFIGASLISIGLGLVLVNLFQPGVGQSLQATVAVGNVARFDTITFLRDIVPSSFFESMSTNNILQVVVFSLFAGVGLAAIAPRGDALVKVAEALSQLMLQVTGYVMRFAPLAVFGAMAGVVTDKGLGILWTFIVFIAEFMFCLALLWTLMIGMGSLVLKHRIWSLLRHVREPLLLAFTTASSESALPRLFEQLDRFGVPRRISGFVLPLGYSFNLDGTMIYMSFVVIFIAQAYNIPLGWQHQVAILLTLMISSKGVAGVPRASIVIITATLSMFGLPVEGISLVLGIDAFLDMGRTVTNVLGNTIAATVITKWEGELGEEEAAS
ncbi:MAG TPA: dicarboxylate/amino acid:cation symporter [Candidatus Acidoferrum sp.]|nr:dicarboxylate/amino acid:cation symporter [Candidatus Acidoferrum sp.]